MNSKFIKDANKIIRGEDKLTTEITDYLIKHTSGRTDIVAIGDVTPEFMLRFFRGEESNDIKKAIVSLVHDYFTKLRPQQEFDITRGGLSRILTNAYYVFYVYSIFVDPETNFDYKYSVIREGIDSGERDRWFMAQADGKNLSLDEQEMDEETIRQLEWDATKADVLHENGYNKGVFSSRRVAQQVGEAPGVFGKSLSPLFAPIPGKPNPTYFDRLSDQAGFVIAQVKANIDKEEERGLGRGQRRRRTRKSGKKRVRKNTRRRR